MRSNLRHSGWQVILEWILNLNIWFDDTMCSVWATAWAAVKGAEGCSPFAAFTVTAGYRGTLGGWPDYSQDDARAVPCVESLLPTPTEKRRLWKKQHHFGPLANASLSVELPSLEANTEKFKESWVLWECHQEEEGIRLTEVQGSSLKQHRGAGII